MSSSGVDAPRGVRRSSAVHRATTREDVARLAGVSTAVVSYVVNNGPRPVAPQTAERVREAMDLLGYRPNASARALRLGKTETIGLVLGDSLNPYFTQYTFELVKAAAERGMRLLIGDSRQDEQLEKEIVDEMIARQVDGLLFASPYSRVDHPGGPHAAGIPTVLIDCPAPVPGQRTVGSAALAGSQAVVSHLIDHGRRRIALIIGDKGFGDPDPRSRGWRLAHRAAGQLEGPMVTVPFTREGGYAGGIALLDADLGIDAVFASSDLQAIGLVRALHERGVRIPEDIAVASFDGTMESEFSWPPLTVARQDLNALASVAIDLLTAPGSAGGKHVEVPTVLVTRASCGCEDSTRPTRPTVDLQLPLPLNSPERND
ncbi:MAG: LacI family DNA-binding transcriptional regulator [Propionicimonas sp.]